MAVVPFRSENTTYHIGGGLGAGAPAAAAVKPPDPPEGQTSTFVINDDGSVSFQAPSVRRTDRGAGKFDENLAESLPDGSLSLMAEEYLNGVAADIMSRSGFIANYNAGIDLLGLKIETTTATRGPRRSISQYRDPALLEACVLYQSAARSEMLPAAGPAKVMTAGASDSAEDKLARNFENDLNYYLTTIAKEYYPDTDRALFYQGFGGTVFKKVYRCPLRRRPVSESVYLTNLIVSEDATDLDNAIRITNEILMSPNQVRKMQLAGNWRDVDLGQPMQNQSAARRKILESQGIAPSSTLPQDQQHTIYEGYFEIDPKDFGFEERGAPEGLPLPYRIVMDKDSRKILELRRNWKKDDEGYRRRKTFVKYELIPGLGFLGYGFLHLIGNSTRLLTATKQLMIDSGMLGNFPGGMKAKGVRTSTNEIAPGLGEFVDIDVGPFDDIRKAIMAMPYKDVSPVFMDLMKAVSEDAQRMSGAVKLEVGEGRSNVPVGTIMAMIEQQTQVMGAVHKRNHTSQKEELELLRELFVEDPGALTRLARKPARKWEVAAEFADLDLVPASDPNVPAQMHRIMQNTFLMQIAQQAPMIFGSKVLKVADRILSSIGISDAEDLLASPEEFQAAQQAAAQANQKPGGGGDGGKAKAEIEAPIKQAQVALQAKKVEGDQQENQRKAASELSQAQQQSADRQAEIALENRRLSIEEAKLAQEHQREVAGMVTDHVQHVQGLDHEAVQAAQDRAHEAGLAAGEQEHQAAEGEATRKAARLQRPKKPKGEG